MQHPEPFLQSGRQCRPLIPIHRLVTCFGSVLPFVGRTASSAPDRWSGFPCFVASRGASEEILETPQ